MNEFIRTLNSKEYQLTKIKFVMDNFVLMGIIISKWKLIKHIEQKWYSFHVQICLFLFDQIIIWKFHDTFSTTSTIDDNLVICILQIAVLIDEYSVVFLYSNYDLKGSLVIFEFYLYFVTGFNFMNMLQCLVYYFEIGSYILYVNINIHSFFLSTT